MRFYLQLTMGFYIQIIPRLNLICLSKAMIPKVPKKLSGLVGCASCDTYAHAQYKKNTAHNNVEVAI